MCLNLEARDGGNKFNDEISVCRGIWVRNFDDESTKDPDYQQSYKE